MGGTELGFFRTLTSFKFGDLARMGDHIEIAGETTDFLAMDAFRAGQIAKHFHQFWIVVGFHLVSQQIVAFDRIDLDLIGDRQQVVKVGDFRTARCFAHSSKSFSSSDKSTLVAPTAG